jgi:hypothetical protein
VAALTTSRTRRVIGDEPEGDAAFDHEGRELASGIDKRLAGHQIRQLRRRAQRIIVEKALNQRAIDACRPAGRPSTRYVMAVASGKNAGKLPIASYS